MISAEYAVLIFKQLSILEGLDAEVFRKVRLRCDQEREEHEMKLPTIELVALEVKREGPERYRAILTIHGKKQETGRPKSPSWHGLGKTVTDAVKVAADNMEAEPEPMHTNPTDRHRFSKAARERWVW